MEWQQVSEKLSDQQIGRVIRIETKYCLELTEDKN